jgi:biofilm protein TabA
MIISTLSTCERYYVLGDGFKKAFEFLKNNDIRNMEPGRYDIDGDKVYDNCGLEAHRRYADVQYVAEGFEYFGYTSLEHAEKPLTEYDPKADAILFEKECQFILLQKGDFAIVFPEDAHMPQKRALIPTPVRKACVKVLVE